MLKISDLSVSLQGKGVLKSVSLDLKRGGFLSLVGPNGAGKSTLLKCICRIYDSFSGEIIVGGKNVATFSRRELAKIVSYVPQMFPADSRCTAFEFAAMSLYSFSGPFSSLTGKEKGNINEKLDLVGAFDLFNKKLSELSGGELKRVLLAAALVQETPLLLLDEPTAGIDPGFEEDLRGIFNTLQKEFGTTVIAATHDLNMGSVMGERIAALCGGKLVFSGTPKAFMVDDVLSGIYGSDFCLVSHPTRDLLMSIPR